MGRDASKKIQVSLSAGYYSSDPAAHSSGLTYQAIIIWILFLFCIVTTRNVLEGFLEYPHKFIGAKAFFVFTLFYFSIFLSIFIVFLLLTRWPAFRLLKYIVSAFSLILVPPVLDWFITDGQGYFLAYPTGTPRQILCAVPLLLEGVSGVSPGMRVEVGLVVICTVIFLAFIARLSWWRVLVGTFLVYMVICVHGLYPGLIAHVSMPTRQAVLLSRIPIQVPPMETRHALVIVFELLILTLICKRKDAVALFRCVRISQSIFYGSMALLGAGLAYSVAPGLTRNIRSLSFDRFDVRAVPVDEMPVRFGLFVLTSFFAYWFAQVVNDRFDIEADLSNKQTNLFVCSNLPAEKIWISAVSALILGIVGALSMGLVPFCFYAPTLLLALIYSMPPLRLKRFPVLSGLTIGLICMLMVFYGFTVLPTHHLIRLFPRELFWILLLALPLGIQVKDMKDYIGDKKTRMWSLPVLFGPVWGKRIIMISIFVAFLIPGFLVSGQLVLFASFLLGLLAVLAVWGLSPKYANKFCMFACILMALVIIIRY